MILSRPNATITLPESRAAQLRTLADAKGIGVTELIEDLINGEISAGRLNDILPGFEVFAVAKTVVASVEGVTIPPLTPIAARKVADMLVHVATASGPKASLAVAPDATMLMVNKVGRGMVIATNKDSQKASLTLRMAHDLARNIRHAADQAQAM